MALRLIVRWIGQSISLPWRQGAYAHMLVIESEAKKTRPKSGFLQLSYLHKQSGKLLDFSR